MLIKSFDTTNCINGCKIFNDNANYLYWENRKVTSDEFDIVNFINSYFDNKSLEILHVGIGNSFLASSLLNFNQITGITISQNEISHAKLKNIPRYKQIFLNKYKKNAFDLFKYNKFDLIIDSNIKSFACCEKSFHHLFNQYIGLLKNKGKIITHTKGLNWTRVIKPKISFSLKKLFYKKLKEYDGPITNILSLNDCKNIAHINNLTFELNQKKIILFSKL